MNRIEDDIFTPLLSEILNGIYNSSTIIRNDLRDILLKQHELKKALFSFYITLDNKTFLAYEIELLKIVIMCITLLYMIRKQENAKDN